MGISGTSGVKEGGRKRKYLARKDRRSGKIRASWVEAHLAGFYAAQERGEEYRLWGKKISAPEDIDGYAEYMERKMNPARLKRLKYMQEWRARKREERDAALAAAGIKKKRRAAVPGDGVASSEAVAIARQFEDLGGADLGFEERRRREIEMVRENPGLFAAIFRSSLPHFISFFHRYLKREEFIFCPHHVKICDALSGRVLHTEPLEKPNLMINLAPRAGKSQIIKYFCAWGYAHNPACNYIVTTCSDKLAFKASAEVREVVASDIFGLLFGVSLDPANKAKELWNTEAGGAFRAAPLRGGIVGFDAGIMSDKWGGAIIIDDMLKPVDANKVSANEEVWDIYKGTIRSRRTNKSGIYKTPIILIAQRLSVLDLCARIKETESEEWEILTVPALQNERSYWEQQISTEELLRMRERDPFTFASQYMQDPIVAGGNLIKMEWFPFFSYRELPPFRRVFMCADTAYTTGKFSDYSAVGLIGVSLDYKLYLLDLLHMKEETEMVKVRLSEFWQYHKDHKFWSGANLSCIVIEKRGTGISLIQDLRRAGAPVREITSPNNKGQRVMECSEYFRNGSVVLPESAMNPISAKFLHEAVSFSEDNKSRLVHDDILDMMMYGVQFGLMSKRGLF